MHGWDVGRKMFSSIKQNSFWPLRVTLTFEVQAWFLSATCHLIMVNMCVKLLGNPMMHGWDVGQNQTFLLTTFWSLSESLTVELQTWILCTTCHLIHGKHVCPVSWESYDAWLRCESDNVVLPHSTHFYLWRLSVTLTLEVQAWMLCSTQHLIMVNMCAQ